MRTRKRPRRMEVRLKKEVLGVNFDDLTREEAAQALLEAGGEAKPAVVKLLLDTDIENARRLLERAEGSVRRAVAD